MNLTDIIKTFYAIHIEACPKSICPSWISREPFTWPWCNLVASQRRPYCSYVNSLCHVGLVSRQWDAVDGAIRSSSSQQCACPFYSSRAGFFWQIIASPRSVSPPYSPDLAPCDFWLFPNLKSPLKGSIFVDETVTQYTSSVNGVSLPTD